MLSESLKKEGPKINKTESGRCREQITVMDVPLYCTYVHKQRTLHSQSLCRHGVSEVCWTICSECLVYSVYIMSCVIATQQYKVDGILTFSSLPPFGRPLSLPSLPIYPSLPSLRPSLFIPPSHPSVPPSHPSLPPSHPSLPPSLPIPPCIYIPIK